MRSSLQSTIAPRVANGWTLFVAVAALLALPAPAGAEKSDREKPISFAGDAGDANLQARGGALTGNVIITQGTLTIRADRIVFRQNADNSLSATAFGNPVAIRQKRDGVEEYYEGFAQRVEYDGAKELVELFDRALLKRGQDEIRSNYVSYNAGTEVFKAEGREGTVPDPAGPGTRVRGTFQPRSEASGPVPGKSKDGAKAAPAATPGPRVTLQPAGELSSPAAK